MDCISDLEKVCIVHKWQSPLFYFCKWNNYNFPSCEGKTPQEM